MWLCVENMDCNRDMSPLKCSTCHKNVAIGELLIKFTGPEVWWCNFRNDCSHHVDCVWPAIREISRKNMMMTNREVNQIKLELNKSPLDQHDMEMLHARLDAMAANHNGYMYSIM